MNKQLKIYLLLGVVLLIWGFVIYRFVDALTPTEPIEDQAFGISEFKPAESKSIDTFTIAKLTRDPFLGKTYVKKRLNPKKTTNKKKLIEKVWPNVLYRGLVSGGSNVYIIDVNNQQFLFAPMDSNAEVILLDGNSNEVILQFGNEKKTFSISE